MCHHALSPVNLATGLRFHFEFVEFVNVLNKTIINFIDIENKINFVIVSFILWECFCFDYNILSSREVVSQVGKILSDSS